MTHDLFTIDSETAFKNAIRKVGNKKWVEDFMYVYTKPADGNYLDYFKHIETREYRAIEREKTTL